ncbi:MAG: cytochrome b5 domain-containing protein [Aquiluna sp.]
MRLALLVASLLVLSGCAAEPAETAAPSAQVSQQAEDDSSMDVEAESSEEEGSRDLEPADSEGTEDSDGERNDEDESERESEAESETESETESEDEPRETQAAEPTQDPEPSQEPTQEQSPEPEPSPTAEETFQGYTLAEVSERDSAAECWVAIDGGVYDLTEWIRSHPGGSGAILNLCGKDGTTSFTSQHGGQARPSSTLDGYYLAPLID